MNLQQEWLNWHKHYARTFLRIAGLTRGYNIRLGMGAALSERGQMVLRQSLRFLLTVDALMAVGGFHRFPISTGEINNGSSTAANVTLAAIFAYFFKIGFIPLVRAVFINLRVLCVPSSVVCVTSSRISQSPLAYPIDILSRMGGVIALAISSFGLRIFVGHYSQSIA